MVEHILKSPADTSSPKSNHHTLVYLMALGIALKLGSQYLPTVRGFPYSLFYTSSQRIYLYVRTTLQFNTLRVKMWLIHPHVCFEDSFGNPRSLSFHVNVRVCQNHSLTQERQESLDHEEAVHAIFLNSSWTRRLRFLLHSFSMTCAFHHVCYTLLLYLLLDITFFWYSC